MNNDETNYDLTIKTKRNTFKFIVALEELKNLLEQINYKEINSVQLEKRKVLNGNIQRND